jgi:ParB family chromosome partitioning protein
MKRSRRIASIPIAAVKPLNSRKRSRARFDELVQSVASVGLKRPVTVRRQAGEYDLVCGLGRLDAVAALGDIEIPALLTEAPIEDCILMGLVENIARWQRRSAELAGDVEVAAKLGLEEEFVQAIANLLKHGEKRLVRFSDLLERTEAKKLTQEAASEVLEISVGTFQRWAERFEAEGDDGLRIGIAADIAQQRLMIDAAAHILIEPGDIGKPHPQHAGTQRKIARVTGGQIGRIGQSHQEIVAPNVWFCHFVPEKD